jgi:hypothetical protein
MWKMAKLTVITTATDARLEKRFNEISEMEEDLSRNTS